MSDRVLPEIDVSLSTGCRLCVERCNVNAIVVTGSELPVAVAK